MNYINTEDSDGSIRAGAVPEENQSDYYSANNFNNHGSVNNARHSDENGDEISTKPVNANKFTYDESDIRVVYLLSEGIQAYEFVLSKLQKLLF